MLVSMLNVIIFSSGLPLLWLFMLVSMILSVYSDKIVLFYGSRKPPRYSGELMYATSLWLQSACWWHCAVAIWVFGNGESAPSFCPRCDGDTMFIGLFDISGLERALSDFEWKVFHTETVGYIADRLCKTSSVPNVFVIVIISVVNLLRFLYFVFGHGVYQNVREAVQLALRSSTRRASEEPQDPTSTQEKASELDEENKPLDEKEPGGEEAGLAKKASARVSAIATSLVAAGGKAEEKNQWKKFLSPWGHERAEIFSKPFECEPMQQMDENKVEYSYNILDVMRAPAGEDDPVQDTQQQIEVAAEPDQGAKPVSSAAVVGASTAADDTEPAATVVGASTAGDEDNVALSGSVSKGPVKGAGNDHLQVKKSGGTAKSSAKKAPKASAKKHGSKISTEAKKHASAKPKVKGSPPKEVSAEQTPVDG